MINSNVQPSNCTKYQVMSVFMTLLVIANVTHNWNLGIKQVIDNTRFNGIHCYTYAVKLFIVPY